MPATRAAILRATVPICRSRIADARFARVLLDHPAQRVVLDGELVARQPVLFELPWDQVLFAMWTFSSSV